MFHSVIGQDRIVRSSLNFEIEDILVYEYFEREWLKEPNAEAVVEAKSGRSLTFGELLEQVKKLAAHLQQQGVHEDRIVAFAAANSLRSCLTFLALIFCKCSIVSLLYSHTTSDLAQMIKNIPVELAFGDLVSTPKFVEIQQQKNTLTRIFCIDSDTFLGDASVEDYIRPRHSDPKKTNLIALGTSGSTGLSKLSQATHHNMIANFLPVQNRGISPGLVRLVTASPAQFSGLFTLLVPLARKQRIVLSDDRVVRDMNKLSDVIQRFGVTNLSVMPTSLNMLINASDGIKLNSVRVIETGGCTMTEAVVKRTREALPNVDIFLVIYSLTETLGLVGLCRNAFQESLGLHVMPNLSVKVVDLISKETLPANESGEIWIKGPTVVQGYLNNQKATEETFCDGWLKSGDVGFYDEQGRFFIVDRIKEMIKCLDLNVEPSDIENIILKNASVESVVVLGVPHNHYGQAPTAFVVPKANVQNLTALSNEITEEIREQCPVHKQLYGGIFFVNDLAKTGTGKFSRRDLLKKHLENRLSYLKM